MTTTTLSERGIGHLADLMCAIRPDWDIAGCVAALRKVRDLRATDLAIAAIRYADDPANSTPAHIADFGNRAWDTDWWTPCKTHPETRARTPNGECASCRADRLGTDGNIQPLQRHNGHPLNPELRAQMLAEIHRAHPTPVRERRKVDVEALAAVRRELEQARETPTRSTPPEPATPSETTPDVATEQVSR